MLCAGSRPEILVAPPQAPALSCTVGPTRGGGGAKSPRRPSESKPRTQTGSAESARSRCRACRRYGHASSLICALQIEARADGALLEIFVPRVAWHERTRAPAFSHSCFHVHGYNLTRVRTGGETSGRATLRNHGAERGWSRPCWCPHREGFLWCSC